MWNINEQVLLKEEYLLLFVNLKIRDNFFITTKCKTGATLECSQSKGHLIIIILHHKVSYI